MLLQMALFHSSNALVLAHCLYIFMPYLFTDRGVDQSCLVKAMVFPVLMYGGESWTTKKAER